MTDLGSSAMDFFNDPSLFVGGLEGLDEDDGFPAAPSLVDELNLSADFEPLQMEPPGQEKNQDMIPHVSTQQSLPSYNDQMGHYIGIKAQNPVGQPFTGAGAAGVGNGRMIGNQHGQYHSDMRQMPESNGMFCNRGSPMWGNQNQNGNMYHNLPQPPQHQQHLHNHQLHMRQQAQQQHHQPCYQQPEQQQGIRREDPNVLFPMQSSSLVHSLPTRSVGSAAAYQPAQFPSYPAEPDLPGLSQQILPSVSRPTANSAALTCTMPGLSGPGSQFPSTDVMSQQHIRGPVSQPEECPFQGLRCSGETQRNLKSSDMFGKSMNCYSSMASPLSSEQPQSCGAIGVNGYQALGDGLLSSGAHAGDLDDLEPPDLLPDLLPQLEAALSQQDETKCSWTTSSQERGHEHRKPPPDEYNKEVGGVISSSEKKTPRRTHHQMEPDLQDKQEKANRIISEAIAKARQRGEKNIPRVMSPESFPSSSSQFRAHRDREHKGNGKARLKEKALLGWERLKRAEYFSEHASSILFSQKRRSNRQVKRKKYAEELEARLSDDEVKVIVKAKKTNAASKGSGHQLFVENPTEEDAAVVDKIMSSRIVKKEVSPGVLIEIEEFFVKYKNYSYLHCEWATEQQLEKDKRIQQKIKRFKMKQAQRALLFADMEEEPFNPDYVEVDRVLEVSYCEDKDTGEEVVYYLVKWCSLPYEDSTWELKDDVDLNKIEEFEQLQAVKPDSRRMERPATNLWKKMEHSREYRNGNTLRDYQLEGVNWLLFNWYNRRNCILADEMGLGKTIQSITFLEEIYRMGIKGPFLIIAPLSTIANWEREFRTWTYLNAIVYHGSMVSRQMLQQYEMYFRDSQGRVSRSAYRFQAVITTFEMILGGCPELNAIEWRCVVIDEAHRLKNKNCKLLEGFKLMNLEHKVLLTGTPLQNTVEELFSLLHFLEPARFPSENTFMQEFGDLKTEEQVQKLQGILKPMMLRRLKEDVEKKLAPKEETIIEVELTNIQKKYYRAILEKNFSFLAKGAGQANMPNLVNTMMELRKCCNHPYLIKGAEEKILEDFREVYNPAAVDFHLQAMVQSAGKLVLIDKLLPKMKAGGHKVLIFSQMVRCLDILEDYLIQRRYLYERIDGRVRGNLRQAAIDRFSKPDSERFVFLLCTRAGGLGINLTAADTCIIFDSDWNPQNDLQAQARCHRIGQNKAVKVYRLITRNSYEREMFDRASLKLGLDKAVLQSMSGRDNSLGGAQQQLSKREIEDLLKRGAYGAIMDEEDEGAKFCEEDIDQILQRRTKTITIESEGRGSTFAKASFVASGNRTDISLDDPNFWDKWAKKADIDMEMVNGRNSLVIDTPRVRKQTRPFSATKDELAELSEGESDGDETKPKFRRNNERLNSYGRTECFRVEKNLLVYGWGRWKDILAHGRFKKQLTEWDVESICRALLSYCLVHYRGDDKIKSFMWDLIAPTEDGRTKELQNHLGLSAPVPRGRKGKKVKTQSSSFDIHKAEWLRKHNPEHILQDDGYKKHLKHHCNKVLLRVRMLYYLKQEVIGTLAQNVLDGADSSEIKIWVPDLDNSELPALWWDAVSDKCLLLGVFKHGYEKYNTIRADPALCFVERVGRPDEKAIAAEQREPVPQTEGQTIYWPSPSVLTARLRRLITASQRFTKSRQILQIHQTQSHLFQPVLECTRIPMKVFLFLRWTRREEADFYRVVSTFGVVFDPNLGRFDWTKFRAMARLHKKTDESLQKYLCAFAAMCRRVCRLPPKEGDSVVDPSLNIQPITEERASRTLYRVELLRQVREQVLRHPLLYDRLSLCQMSSDLPVWWEAGTHDRDLLIGAAKHGVSRTDYHILRDPELSFMVAQRKYSQTKAPQQQQSCTPTSLLHPQSQVSSFMLTGSPLPPPAQRDADPCSIVPKVEPASEGEEGREKQGERWSPPPPATPTGLEEKPVPEVKDGEQQMVAARTKPLTPNSSERKPKKPSKRVPAATSVKGFDEDSVASLSTTQDETQVAENGIANSSSHPLQEGGYMLAASYWPKDRVIINRLDSICQAVLKGKWPETRRVYEPGGAVASFYTTKLLDNANSLCEDPSASPQGSKEGGLKLTFQKQGLPLKRPLESEEGPQAQQQYLARLHELQNASDTGLADITKPQCSFQSGSYSFPSSLKTVTGLLPADFAGQMRLNGVLDSQPVVKKRRGRRKNVEGMDLLFMNKSRVPAVPEQVSMGATPALQYCQSSTQGTPDTESRVPVINLKDGTRLAGDDAPKRKDLEQWLNEHPGFVADTGGVNKMQMQFHFQDGRPKQKRHRCRNPNKIDVNSLTGEERVQIINRRNARKVLTHQIEALSLSLCQCAKANVRCMLCLQPRQ
uniref:Chromodomain helicase DNA binding protein 9 n=1 Tax=Takifugu rubripes TaxID=31033 RepID=A0A674MHI4_TAKRU